MSQPARRKSPLRIALVVVLIWFTLIGITLFKESRGRNLPPGPVTTQKASLVQPGMTVSECEAILGAPDTKESLRASQIFKVSILCFRQPDGLVMVAFWDGRVDHVKQIGPLNEY